VFSKDPLYQLLRGDDIKAFNAKRDGFGGLARSLRPLLAPFGCRIQAYDPWLTDAYLRDADIRGIDFSNALMEGVSLRGARISGAARSGACSPGSRASSAIRALRPGRSTPSPSACRRWSLPAPRQCSLRC